jgi:hypothetical protein
MNSGALLNYTVEHLDYSQYHEQIRIRIRGHGSTGLLTYDKLYNSVWKDIPRRALRT